MEQSTNLSCFLIKLPSVTRKTKVDKLKLDPSPDESCPTLPLVRDIRTLDILCAAKTNAKWVHSIATPCRKMVFGLGFRVARWLICIPKIPVLVYIFWKMLVYFMALWIFSGHLEYFTAIWYVLWPFGIFYGHFWSFGIIVRVWYVIPRKIWQPCLVSSQIGCRSHVRKKD
jgi:hypothetical protein